MLSARLFAHQGLLLHSEKRKHKEKRVVRNTYTVLEKKITLARGECKTKKHPPKKRIVYSHKKKNRFFSAFSKTVWGKKKSTAFHF